MADTLKKFGKFFLLDLLAQGGMAEIYRARHATPTGGGRLLAMKRIMQSYSSNPEFIGMFRGETKVTSGFTHPNIVQVYDYGEEQGQLYIAMEYVDGRNLRQFITRLSDLKALFPIEVSCFIVEQSAQALHYAHDFKDKFSGKSLNIIHRDVSPQNILVSYDGAVKVIDFGIAKAETQSESTRAGVIKGKPSYLSPEQISGEVLDGRSDVFALAVVFWELLTGKKLFAGDNDLAVIRMVENCQNHIKPPSMFNPKIPKELDAIVLKALEKDRSRRYQTAGELQRAIHKFLYQFSSEFNPADLSFYARDLFKNEIVEDRKRIQKLNERAEQLLSLAETELAKLPPIPAVANSTSKPTPSLEATGDAKEVLSVPELEAPSKAKEKPGVTLSQEDEKTASSITLENIKGNLRTNNKSPDTNAQVRSGHTSMNTVAGGVSRTSTALRRPRPEPGISFHLPKVAGFIVAALGLGYFYLNYGTGPTERQPAGQINKVEQASVVQESAPAENAVAQDKTIMLQFKISPAGGAPHAKINGNPVNIESGAVPVKLDQVLEVIIERPNFETYKKTVMYESQKLGSTRDTLLEVELIPLKFGFLSINTTPSAEGYIYIDGAQEPVQTPLSGKRLPVGTYKVRLENKLLQMSKEITVVIQENQVKKIEERLSVITDSN